MSTNLETKRYPFESCTEEKKYGGKKLSELLWEISSLQ